MLRLGPGDSIGRKHLLPAIAESILAHAWLYLLTNRLDSDQAKLATDVMQPWLRHKPA